MLRRLEEAYERGQKGQVPSYDFWLHEQGYDQTRLNGKAIFEFLISQQPVNQQQALDEIGEYLGYFSNTKKGKLHLVVTGVQNSGKTYIASMIRRFLEEKTKLRSKTLNAGRFGEVEENEQAFHNILDEIEEEKYEVLLIDDCHNDKNIQYSLRQINAKLKTALIVTMWEPVCWDYLAVEVESILPPSKVVMLKQFSEADTVELLSQVVEFVSRGKVKADKETLQEIHAQSEGIPGISVMMFVETLRETFDQGLKSIDKKTVSSVARSQGIVGLDEKLRSLNDIHLSILRQIILSQDERGIRPTSLVQVLNRDKATVSYYLRQMCQQGILDYTKSGISVFYQIPDVLRPFVQLRLSTVEGDFIA